ncbi:MAG: hypothetical protein GF307_06385 [candidate division Zixibacteria bacterium]|nr:hypothetical protein [candidate division Zixibacteria bacterium]
MPWSADYLKDEGIILLKSRGENNLDDYIEQTRKIAEMVNERNILEILLDHSELINKASLTEIYEIPKLYEAHNLNRNVKIAVIVSKDLSQELDFEFFEDICRNRGWNMKLFRGREPALRWLKS